MHSQTTNAHSLFGFQLGRRTADGPAMERLRAIAGRGAPDPAGEGLRAARRHTLVDAHLAWQRGDTAGAAVLRAIADALGRQLAARQGAF